MSVRGYDSFLVTTNLGANRKMRRLTPAERWCAVHGVWAIAAESPKRGHLWIADGVPATEKDYAEMAGVSTAIAQSTVRKMRELGMLHPDDDEVEFVHDWHQHQRDPKPSDSPEARRERKRKQRARHSNVTRDNGQCHEGEVEDEDKEKEQTPSVQDRERDLLRWHGQLWETNVDGKAWGKRQVESARWLLENVEAEMLANALRWAKTHSFWSGRAANINRVRQEWPALRAQFESNTRPARAKTREPTAQHLQTEPEREAKKQMEREWKERNAV